MECEETTFSNLLNSAGTSYAISPQPLISPKSIRNSPILNGSLRAEELTFIVQDGEVHPSDIRTETTLSSTPKKQQQQQLQYHPIYKSHPNIPDVCPVNAISHYSSVEEEEEQDQEQAQEDFSSYLDDDDPLQPLFQRTRLCTILEDDVVEPIKQAQQQRATRGKLQRQLSIRSSSPISYHEISSDTEEYIPIPPAQPQQCCQVSSAASFIPSSAVSQQKLPSQVIFHGQPHIQQRMEAQQYLQHQEEMEAHYTPKHYADQHHLPYHHRDIGHMQQQQLHSAYHHAPQQQLPYPQCCQQMLQHHTQVPSSYVTYNDTPATCSISVSQPIFNDGFRPTTPKGRKI